MLNNTSDINSITDYTSVELLNSNLILHSTEVLVNEDNECPICFENMKIDEPVLILDCCNKKIHLRCIIDWYDTHRENKTCFICNQSNNFCKDLIYSGTENIKPIQLDNSNIIGIFFNNCGPLCICIIIIIFIYTISRIL